MQLVPSKMSMEQQILYPIQVQISKYTNSIVRQNVEWKFRIGLCHGKISFGIPGGGKKKQCLQWEGKPWEVWVVINYPRRPLLPQALLLSLPNKLKSNFWRVGHSQLWSVDAIQSAFSKKTTWLINIGHIANQESISVKETGNNWPSFKKECLIIKSMDFFFLRLP